MSVPIRAVILIAGRHAYLSACGHRLTNLHIAVPSLPLALGASVTEALWIIDIYPLLIAGMLALLGLPLVVHCDHGFGGSQ